MAIYEKELDITRSIKTIELLKSELVTDMADLFRALVNGVKEETQEAVSDALSNMIIVCYLLGKRLGVSYNFIEMKIRNKIKVGLLENNDMNKYYGDLTELSKHLDSFRRKEKQ